MWRNKASEKKTFGKRNRKAERKYESQRYHMCMTHVLEFCPGGNVKLVGGLELMYNAIEFFALKQ